MLKHLLGRFTRAQRVAPEAWESAWSQLPWLNHLNRADQELLKSLAAQFIEQKQFTGVHGFVMSDPVRVSIALQACLPVLRLGLDYYRDFVEIIIYPDRFIVPRQLTDDHGIVQLSKQPPVSVNRRQDSPQCFDMNASIYVWRRDALFKNETLFTKNTRLFVMPSERSIDIDSQTDFEMVEWMMTKGSAK